VCDQLKERFFVVVEAGSSEAGVPEADESVVGAAGEKAGVEAVPGHVLDGGVVVKDLEDGQIFAILLSVLLNVPDADAFVCET